MTDDYAAACASDWAAWIEAATAQSEPVGIGSAGEWSSAEREGHDDNDEGPA